MIAYALMALTLLVAALWLTRPWWGSIGRESVERRATNIAIYRQRLVEIDVDLAAGLLEPTSAEALRQELGVRLMNDVENDGDSKPHLSAQPGGRLRAYPIALLVLLLAVFGGGGYYLLGSWETQGQIEQAAANPQQAQQLSMTAMIEKLKAKLQAQPDDPEGWAMLGRSHGFLGQYAESAKAYAKASELTGNQQPDLLVDEGEALALSRDRDLLGRPRQLFEQALALAADNGKALWYAGLAAAQAEEPQLAQKYWTQLSQQQLPPELRAALDERLQALTQLTGQPVPVSDTPKVADPGLRLRLSIKPELLARVPAGATLFVFAKAAAGPPMPLAVYRGLASELPREVGLDDSMAMTPALKLSQFDRWIVTARVSLAGQAKAQSGDVEGTRELTRAEAAASVDIVLDRVIP